MWKAGQQFYPRCFATDYTKIFDDKLKNNKVVLFLKGTPQAPQCGFSNHVVQILKYYGIENYASINITKTEELKKAAKEYTKWPTFPQLYINGELVGGSDIISEMHNNKEFESLLRKQGVIL